MSEPIDRLLAVLPERIDDASITRLWSRVGRFVSACREFEMECRRAKIDLDQSWFRLGTHLRHEGES